MSIPILNATSSIEKLWLRVSDNEEKCSVLQLLVKSDNNYSIGFIMRATKHATNHKIGINSQESSVNETTGKQM